ncbi:hypothetical protein D9M72_628590 [compost metagenome]
MHVTAVGNTGGADAPENGVELLLAHAKAQVQQWERLAPLVEVQGQAVIQVHRHERAHAAFRPGHPEQLGQQARRRQLVARRHHQVIQMNGHGALLCLSPGPGHDTGWKAQA